VYFSAVGGQRLLAIAQTAPSIGLDSDRTIYLSNVLASGDSFLISNEFEYDQLASEKKPSKSREFACIESNKS